MGKGRVGWSIAHSGTIGSGLPTIPRGMGPYGCQKSQWQVMFPDEGPTLGDEQSPHPYMYGQI